MICARHNNFSSSALEHKCSCVQLVTKNVHIRKKARTQNLDELLDYEIIELDGDYDNGESSDGEVLRGAKPPISTSLRPLSSPLRGHSSPIPLVCSPPIPDCDCVSFKDTGDHNDSCASIVLCVVCKSSPLLAHHVGSGVVVSASTVSSVEVRCLQCVDPQCSAVVNYDGQNDGLIVLEYNKQHRTFLLADSPWFLSIFRNLYLSRDTLSDVHQQLRVNHRLTAESLGASSLLTTSAAYNNPVYLQMINTKNKFINWFWGVLTHLVIPTLPASGLTCTNCANSDGCQDALVMDGVALGLQKILIPPARQYFNTPHEQTIFPPVSNVSPKRFTTTRIISLALIILYTTSLECLCID